MQTNPKILVFSDLDGTLLDHKSYSWRLAEPALARLRAEKIGLVLSTSKTAVEVAPLRSEIGFADWPSIVENGGGILSAGQEISQDATVYATLRDTLKGLPPGFRGFGDMTVEEISQRTGLSLESTYRAKARQYSEPGIWIGTESDLNRFLAAAKDAGLSVQRGGRFMTLSFGGTKADRMNELIGRFAPECTIALGDAPNDIAMLERADYGVIIANTASTGIPRLQGEDTGRIQRTKREGPAGWADAIFKLLDELTKTREQATHG